MIVHSHEMKARAAFFAEEEVLKGPLPPSERDLEVYESVVIEGETTRSAANGFELSQTRIVQICERVAEWVASTLPETPRLSPRQRLRLASHVAEGRLDHLYSLAMQAFDKSMGEQTTVRVSDHGETTITRTSCGDIKYLSLASRLAERKYAVVLRGLQGAKGLEREGEAGREGEAPAEPRGQGSGFGVQRGADGGPQPASGVRQHPDDVARATVVNHREAHASRSPMNVPPVGDCSRFADASGVASGVRQHPDDVARAAVVNHREAHASRSPMNVPPVGDCSRFADASGVASGVRQHPDDVARAAVVNHREAHASRSPTADESAVYDEIERRRRAFLAALDNDTSPVQPPRVDAGGMLVEDETEDRGQETEELAGVLPMARTSQEQADCGRTSPALPRPLSRRERRARQRILEKKLRLRKAK